ncbi:MAG TPA: hypothetical protein VE175_03600, partial [Woeseiaceae bacterium]|nr:hypothetical protein [Woeseiaceae bacterium]
FAITSGDQSKSMVLPCCSRSADHARRSFVSQATELPKVDIAPPFQHDPAHEPEKDIRDRFGSCRRPA